MILELSKTFLSWLIILPVTFLTGSWFRPFIRFKNFNFRGICYCAIGMAALSYGIVLLSYLHILNPLVIWLGLILLLGARLKEKNELINWLKSIFRDLSGPNSWIGRVLVSFFIFSFAALLVGTLTPEIGGDALCYQLNLPKVFLTRGSVAPDYFDLNSYFPMFLNNLYLIGLATGGVLSAKLFHFFCGFLLFLTLMTVIREETGKEILAYFIALVVWLTPAIYHMLSTTYVDMGLTFYTFLSLVTLVMAFREGGRFSFFMSGFLAGCALSIKYLAVISTIALLVVWIADFMWRQNFGKLKQELAPWLSGLGLAGAFWYLRNCFLTGNPFFPYFSGLFGTEAIPGTHYEIYGTGKGLWDFISIFWNMFYVPFFINPAGFGSFGDRVGIFYFLFIPFIVLAAIFVPGSRRYALFSFVFVLGWFCVSQVDRFLLPALPALATAAAFGFDWVSAQLLSKTSMILKISAGSLGVTLLVFDLIAGIFHYRYSYLLFFGVWPRSEYLKRMERTFAVANWINQNLPKRAKILIEAEPRQFYFDRAIVRDFYLRYRTHYDRQQWATSSLRDFLKSFGITHILIDNPIHEINTPRPERELRSLIESGLATKIYSARSENIRDAQHFYQVYELN